MGLLSDSRGRKEWFNMGDVSLLEATSSTLYFIGSAAFLSNFDVQVPMPDGTLTTMSDVLASYSVPVLGTATFTVGLTMATLLMLYQIYDSATSYGRSNAFDVKGWYNSIPTGLTVAVGAVVVLHGAYLFDIGAVLNFIDSNYWYSFGAIVISTATYWAISSQG